MKKNAKTLTLTLILIAFFAFDAFAQIKVYTMNGCGRCAHVVAYLKEKNIAFVEYNTTTSEKNNSAMWALLDGKASGSISMPVIDNYGEVAFSIKNLDSYLSNLKSGGKDKPTPEPERDSEEFVTIFEHASYKGKSQKLQAGEYDINDLAIGNDQLSSLKVPEGMFAVLYEHGNYEGKYLEITSNQAYVGNEFNDKTSAIVVGFLEEPKPEEEPTDPKPKPEPNTNTSTFKGCPKGTENVAAQNEAFEKKVLELVNIERKKVGKPALVWSPDLARAARYHAADMATEEYFDHSSYDVENGVKTKVCDTFERIAKFGKGYAENIAWGSNTPEGAVNQWMNSAGHKRNILSDSEAIGIGFYNNYWVQVFGSK